MATKKTSLPKYDARRGMWIGGDTRTLYTFTGKVTGGVGVYPGGGPRGKLLMNWGPEATVRLATRAEAEEHWQNPLHAGWKVAESTAHATKKTGAAGKMAKTMHEWKHGDLRSGGGKKVTSRKQAIAIGLSQSRHVGSSHSKMLGSPVVATEPVTLPNGSSGEIHIHHGKGGYAGVLVLSSGKELPMTLGVPIPKTAAEAVRGAKKFFRQVYGHATRRRSSHAMKWDKDDALEYGRHAFRMEQLKAEALANARAQGFAEFQLASVETGWEREKSDTVHGGGFSGSSHARRRGAHATMSIEGPYRVAYGTSDGKRTFRVYDPNVFTTLDGARTRFRVYKRQGLWAWIEDEHGTFVPIEGAKSSKVQQHYPVR